MAAQARTLKGATRAEQQVLKACLEADPAAADVEAEPDAAPWEDQEAALAAAAPRGEATSGGAGSLVAWLPLRSLMLMELGMPTAVVGVAAAVEVLRVPHHAVRLLKAA